ncbi:MAG: hypothetical protein EPN88_06295, partial [Bacteroidetes bacterium]
GFVHTRYFQYHNGIRVEQAEVIVHQKGVQIISINGEVSSITNLSISPSISANQSIQLALNELKAKRYAWEDPTMESWIKENTKDENSSFYPKPELVIWTQNSENKNYLAYKIEVATLEPFGSKIIIINALNGEIIHISDLMKGSNTIGTAVTRYSGTVSLNTESFTGGYRLIDISRGNHIETKNSQRTTDLWPYAVDFTDNNNIWDEFHNTNMDDAALDAHYAAQKTYDYFKNTFGRNSYDNNNSIVRLFVHYKVNENNSYWIGSPWYSIVMGDGDGTLCSPLTSCDAVAHEFGHAITRSYTNMYLTGEPASINEGLSNIWGACVEVYANIPGNLPWVVGEDYQLQPNHAIDLHNPNSSHYHIDNILTNPANPYTDTYHGINWYYGNSDNQGEHYNSTVLSHWFNLLSQGGAGNNENNRHYVISGIGISKAAQIVYNYYNYITPGSDYSMIDTYTRYIATQLFGNNSNEAIQTWNAWYAVGTEVEVPNLITGESLLCSYTNYYTYSLPPEFAGETITWNPGSNLQIISGQGSRIITVQSLNNGSSTITAVYNHGNGNITSQKTVWVGIPQITNQKVDGGSYYPGKQICPGNHWLNVTPVGEGAGNATWIVPSGIQYIVGTNTLDFTFPSYLSGIAISARSANSCGTSTNANFYLSKKTYGCSGYYGMTLYPNPVSDNVTITMIENSPLVETSDSGLVSAAVVNDGVYEPPTYTIRIYNNQSTLIYTLTRSGKSFSIPLINMLDGTYIIEVNNGKNCYRQQLIVKHK